MGRMSKQRRIGCTIDSRKTESSSAKLAWESSQEKRASVTVGYLLTSLLRPCSSGPRPKSEIVRHPNIRVKQQTKKVAPKVSQVGPSKEVGGSLQSEHNKRCVSRSYFFSTATQTTTGVRKDNSMEQVLGTPDVLSELSSNRNKLLFLQSVTIAKENITKSLSNELQACQSKETINAQLKSKVSEKKKANKKEMAEVCRLKKQSKVSTNIYKKDRKSDEKVSKNTKSRDYVLKNDPTIQRLNKAIQTLQREIELLKENQECNVMEYDLLHQKGYKGVLSETVWQLKSMKIRHQYIASGKEINRLSNKVYKLQQIVEDLLPDYPLFRRKSKGRPYLHLPLRLYSILEETEQDMIDYEEGVYKYQEQKDFIFDLKEHNTDTRYHWKLLFGRV